MTPTRTKQKHLKKTTASRGSHWSFALIAAALIDHLGNNQPQHLLASAHTSCGSHWLER